MDCLMGIDLGSTSLKSVVYDLEGQRLRVGAAPQKFPPIRHIPTGPSGVRSRFGKTPLLPFGRRLFGPAVRVDSGRGRDGYGDGRAAD